MEVDGVKFQEDIPLKNLRTDEIFEAHGVLKKIKKENFYKVWLFDLLNALGLIGNKKIQVFDYLISAMDKSNRIIKSQVEIAEDLGVSRKTVADTFKLLREAGILIKQKNNVYIMNPKVIWFGDEKRQKYLLIEYDLI